MGREAEGSVKLFTMVLFSARQGREEEGKLQTLAVLGWQREKRRSTASLSSISFPGETLRMKTFGRGL